MRALVIFWTVVVGANCASATELGLASFYGAGGLTAAHRTLPMGSRVRVVNLDNGREVIVRIVDRGPFLPGRIIDVSTATAETLGFREAGLAHVKIETVSLEAAKTGPRPEQRAAYAAGATSSSAICRYGADRLAHLQGDPVGGEGALSRDALGCQDLRSRLFLFAQRAEDLAPIAARGGVFLTEGEAAASIPVTAVAEVPAPAASLTGMEAAASIPVSALADIARQESSFMGPARGCDAATPCRKRQQLSASNPFAFFFARLRQIFD